MRKPYQVKKLYRRAGGRLSVLLETKSKHRIRLKAVQTQSDTDYYLEVKSDARVSQRNRYEGAV